jgi:pimeloyl-ACP methyl ester carboxylesterase
MGLVRALPRALTKLDPEALSFLSEDRYDTGSAETHAASAGLAMPPLDTAVERWCDHLVSTRFGAAPDAERGAFRRGAYCVGDPSSADLIYLHGLPWNGDAWQPVASAVGASHARPDLPGLGRSAPSALDAVAWLDQLLGPRKRPVVLVGHSLGANFAVRYAHARPKLVSGVVLVSPAFLQRPARPLLRVQPLVALALGRSSPDSLAQRLGHTLENGAPHPAVVSACRDLSRKGVAARAATALARASRSEARAELVQRLDELEARVQIVHGSRDPLVVEQRHPVRVIDGAGHEPHLSAPGEIAATIESFVRSERPARAPCRPQP